MFWVDEIDEIDAQPMPNSPHSCEVAVGVSTSRLTCSARRNPDLLVHVIFVYVARSRGGVKLGRTSGKIVGCQRLSEVLLLA